MLQIPTYNHVHVVHHCHSNMACIIFESFWNNPFSNVPFCQFFDFFSYRLTAEQALPLLDTLFDKLRRDELVHVAHYGLAVILAHQGRPDIKDLPALQLPVGEFNVADGVPVVLGGKY